MLPIDEIANMSFFSQQFLANSGHLSSKKYQQELELLHSTLSVSSSDRKSARQQQSTSDQSGAALLSYMSRMVSNLTPITDDPSSLPQLKKDLKTRIADLEKRLDEQLDSTQVLNSDLAASSWKWLEIIRLFEVFLLDRSSFYPNFSASSDARLFQKCKRKILTENQKLVKFIKKLFDFYTHDPSTSSTSSQLLFHGNQSASQLATQISHSPRNTYFTQRLSQAYTSPSSFTSTSSNNEQISCAGCYLIDFCLGELNVESVAQNQFGSVIEFVVVQFLQSVRQQLVNEFPLTTATVTASQSGAFLQPLASSFRASFSQASTASAQRALTKDSILALCILLLGHMSANPKGDLLLEHFKIYDLIVKIIDIHHDVGLVKLVVSTFNFYTSPKSRVILERALCTRVLSRGASQTVLTYNELKIYMLKLVLNLFRAHNLKFEAFFVRILFKSMLFALDSDDFDESMDSLLSPASVRFSNEQVLELAINSIEYICHLRPDLLDQLLDVDYDDELIKSVDGLVIKCRLAKRGGSMTRARFLRTKLEMLSFRLKMCDSRMAKMSLIQVWKFYRL